MSVVLQPHVEERLRSDTIIWLTTVRPNGCPHTIPVWFVWENATVLIFSKVKTQKVRNLRQNHSVMLALDDTKNGRDVVIFEGTAQLFERGEGREVLEAYGEKYREGFGVPQSQDKNGSKIRENSAIRESSSDSAFKDRCRRAVI